MSPSLLCHHVVLTQFATDGLWWYMFVAQVELSWIKLLTVGVRRPLIIICIGMHRNRVAPHRCWWRRVSCHNVLLQKLEGLKRLQVAFAFRLVSYMPLALAGAAGFFDCVRIGFQGCYRSNS